MTGRFSNLVVVVEGSFFRAPTHVPFRSRLDSIYSDMNTILMIVRDGMASIMFLRLTSRLNF